MSGGDATVTCHKRRDPDLVITAEYLRTPRPRFGRWGEVRRPHPSAEARLWGRVHKGSPDECWEWPGASDAAGYGQMGVGGQLLKTHRISFVLAYGPIPDGHVVMHACDNPPCCNPAHLSAGTVADNNADKEAKGRGKGAPRALLNGKGKLSDEDVRAIRLAHSNGENCASIARRMGLDNSYAWRIANGHVRRAVA